MSTKRIVAIIFLFTLIMLFVYPSTDNSINAGQSKSVQNAAALTNARQISVSSIDVIVQYFGKDIVEKTMKQPGCVGVRMYYGKHKDGTPDLMIIGVDKNGKEMAPGALTCSPKPCPPNCGG